MTQTHAVVWHYGHGSKPQDSSNVMEIRLLNPPSHPRQPLPLGVLVSTSSEPGLLVVMPASGKITFWESLSNAASGDVYRQRQQSIQGSIGGLTSGETVIKITEAEPRGFILTCSSGRLIHMAINDSQGRPSIETQFLRSPTSSGGGVFGSLRHVFSSSTWKKDVAAVKAGRSAQRGQRSVIIGTSTGVFQVWDMNWNGNHTLVYEIDAKDDILKALSEGAEVFHDGHKHLFEVIDFTVVTGSKQGNEMVKQTSDSSCSLMLLTALKGPDAFKYSLVGLTLSNSSVAVEVVHPITCYTDPIPVDVDSKAQILIPESNETAFVIFEKSIVLVSLVEVEETPDSQLQLEAHTLPEPFQDVIDFKRSKPYQVVGCSTDLYEKSHASTAILVLVSGFGLVRITTFAQKSGESQRSRNTVTAQTKIEQAVFFGGLRQDLVDFTPRSEIRFTAADVEKAALNISHAIASSTSKYLPVIGPSMEQQLARRASALASLNKHIRQHYPAISRLGRWQLLWTAEKMAAAQALWQCYQTSIKDPVQTTDTRNVFTELVEAIHPDYKIENQPENNETDGVRHWFIHDIWRLEWIIPYAEEIVETMFKESVEDSEEFDLPTRARMATEASDIQLAALETAFRFREANYLAYGLDGEAIGDGVLSKGYEGLPEIWTSIPEVVGKVKMMTDVSRETALALDNPQADEPRDDGASVNFLYKLAEDNPRQVHLCCQLYTERYRWLQSREDRASKEKGLAFKNAYLAVRRDLLTRLAEISQSQPAIDLAERYHDMDALAEVIDFEMQNAENVTAQEALTQRITANFVKYGTSWANAYFTRHLDGADAVRTLNQTSHFKKHLTKFLRSHQEYAKIGWINEILAEENLTKASDFLGQVYEQGEEDSTLWSQKIALSMQKLTVLAGKSNDKATAEKSKSRAGSIDKSLESLAIQDKLCEYIRPSVSDALDADAAIDLAMQRVGNPGFLANKPTMTGLLRQDLQRLLVHSTLPPDRLIDLLTLISPDAASAEPTDAVDNRFFSALKVLHSLHPKTFGGQRLPIERTIWTRCILADDWPELNRTDMKSDSQVTAIVSHTALYRTLVAGFRTSSSSSSALSGRSFWDEHPPLSPDDASLLPDGEFSTDAIAAFRASWPRHADTPANVLADLVTDMHKQTAELLTCLKRGRLEHWWTGLLDAARQHVRADADAEGEELAAKMELEKEMREQEKQRRERVRAGWQWAGLDGVWEDDDIEGDYTADGAAGGDRGRMGIGIRDTMTLGGPETGLRSALPTTAINNNNTGSGSTSPDPDADLGSGSGFGTSATDRTGIRRSSTSSAGLGVGAGARGREVVPGSFLTS